MPAAGSHSAVSIHSFANKSAAEGISYVSNLTGRKKVWNKEKTFFFYTLSVGSYSFCQLG